MRSLYKKIRIALYVVLAFVLIDIISYIVLAALKFFSGDAHTFTEILFAIVTPALIFAWALILTKDIELRQSFRTLKTENIYYLGKECDFYNLQLFERQVYRINRRHKKMNSYMISFTACSQEVSANLIRNNIVIQYNGLISDMVVSYFSKNRLFRHFDSTYCYNKDSFLIYLVGEEERVNKILRDLEANLYAIAKDNQIRLFVQPFFGVASYDSQKDFSINVENAVLTRLQSEKSFQVATYYDESNKMTIELDEIQEILDGLKNKEFVVYYQPKYNLLSKKFISSEALIRWNSPKHGFIAPSKFIPQAEAAGLIHDLDMYVFRQVCNDLNETKKRGRRIIPVSINFSLYEFYSPNFIEDIVGIIDEAKLSHNLIEIEITETTSESNPFLAISIMRKLKEQGMRVLMDDFGVGYSNFSNLKKMPIDSLKIDKSFIDEIVADNKTREIVKFLINLGKTNGLEVIAEGVDNAEQVEILRKAKLDTIQGYFYSKPLSKKDYDAFLISNPYEKKEVSEKWF